MTKICINPGHGAGGDYGACANGRREADDVLRIGLALRDRLTAAGVEVLMTREGEGGPVIADCVRMANAGHVDYFISLHENAGGGTGAEAWVYSKADQRTTDAAHDVLRAYEEATGLRDRGVKRGAPGYDDFAVCKDTAMPAVLLEMGFVDNAADMAANDANIGAIADKLAAALCGIVGASASVVPDIPTPPPAPAEYPEPARIITQGCEGDAVKWLQQRLQEQGHSIGGAGIDGKCGPATVAAIQAFQAAQGLTVDGKAGTMTVTALGGGNPFPAPGRTLRSGDTGDGVKWVQFALACKNGYDIGSTGIDGKYGAATTAAVRNYQGDHGLSVDGIVGPATRAALGD